MYFYFWLCWVFAAAWVFFFSDFIDWGLLFAMCNSFLLQWFLLFQNTGSRVLGPQ